MVRFVKPEKKGKENVMEDDFGIEVEINEEQNEGKQKGRVINQEKEIVKKRYNTDGKYNKVISVFSGWQRQMRHDRGM